MSSCRATNAKALGISIQTFAMLLAGLSVQRGTLALVRQNLRSIPRAS